MRDSLKKLAEKDYWVSGPSEDDFGDTIQMSRLSFKTIKKIFRRRSKKQKLITLRKIFDVKFNRTSPETRAQRCWVHKTANVLDRLPKRVQGEAKSMLHEIWGSDTRERAKEAFERFCATWEAKYPKAAECLARDREELLAFYDFPAAHWQSLRTTNPIESTFATIRLRTAKTRNCLSEKTALSLVHQLAMSAEKRWRRLRGLRYLADVITDVRFIDGVNEKEIGREAAEFRTAIHQIWP